MLRLCIYCLGCSLELHISFFHLIFHISSVWNPTQTNSYIPLLYLFSLVFSWFQILVRVNLPWLLACYTSVQMFHLIKLPKCKDLFLISWFLYHNWLYSQWNNYIWTYFLYFYWITISEHTNLISFFSFVKCLFKIEFAYIEITGIFMVHLQFS